MKDDFWLSLWIVSGGWKWILSGLLSLGSVVTIFELPFIGIPLVILGIILFIQGLKSEKLIDAKLIFGLLILLGNCIIGFVWLCVW